MYKNNLNKNDVFYILPGDKEFRTLLLFIYKKKIDVEWATYTLYLLYAMLYNDRSCLLPRERKPLYTDEKLMQRGP